MPRITGPNIVEHVARQEAAVIAAATGLFAERGFTRVTMSDIAHEVGLARTSLYRYFPDKDHILLAWLRNETADLLTRSQAVATADRPASTRLRDWLTLQLDYIADADHRLFSEVAASMGSLSPVVQAAIGEEHARIYGSVDQVVAEALADADATDRDPVVVTALVIGLLRAANDLLNRGVDRAVATGELVRSALALVQDDGSSEARDDGV